MAQWQIVIVKLEEKQCRNQKLSDYKNGQFWNCLSGAVMETSKQTSFVINFVKFVNWSLCKVNVNVIGNLSDHLATYPQL